MIKLTVQQNGSPFKEFDFDRGPVYIGRHTHSQVFLPHNMVSRQHAVIYLSSDGRWLLEDLDSANKTYVNDKVIHKNEIKDGDVIRIGEFDIDVKIDVESQNNNAIDLSDTLADAYIDTQVIVKKPDTEHAPAMRLPAKRASDFVEATESICKAEDIDSLLLSILKLCEKQFSAYHCWCALRELPTGDMTHHSGRRLDGKIISFEDIPLREKITESVERSHFMLLPKIGIQDAGEDGIRSALIAPVTGPSGCFGVIYLDNSRAHERYVTSDLDYLMLFAIHTAAIVNSL